MKVVIQMVQPKAVAYVLTRHMEAITQASGWANRLRSPLAPSKL